MLKKRILAIGFVMLSMPLMAGAKNLDNKYAMTGVTLSNAQSQKVQGVNLEINWVDYRTHYTEYAHKHQLNGFGIKLNTDESKFKGKYSDVREVGVYGKRGFELEDDSNFYGLVSIGVGLVETSNPKNKAKGATMSSNNFIHSAAAETLTPESPENVDPVENEKKEGDSSMTGNPNTDEEISFSAEIGLGLGYYSRDGSYAASVEVLGQHYEKGDFDPAVRVMFGWRF